MSKVLVTGGGGFIGSHLVEGLLKTNHAVRVLDDFSTGKRDNLAPWAKKIELITGSITDKTIVHDAVNGCEVIHHLAALPSVAKSVEDPVASHDICTTGTLNVLNSARQLGVRRVVYAASSSCYGDIPGAVRREDEPVSPLSPYAAAKLAGEHYCKCFSAVYPLETVRLRFFNVFGPRQDALSPYSGVIAIFLSAMCEGRVPRVDGDGLQSRDFVYVANVVQALLKAAVAPKASGNVYNIGVGTSSSVLDLVRSLNQLLGTNIVPTHGPPRTGDVRHSQADITLARCDLGYDPQISFHDGLRQTLDWFRATKA